MIDEFEDELEKIRKKYSNKKEAIRTKLESRSYTLAELGERALASGYFDKIEGSEELYEMRLMKKNPNLRVLFAFLPDNKIIYLTIFNEKNKSDYERYIAIAENRLKIYIRNNY